MTTADVIADLYSRGLAEQALHVERLSEELTIRRQMLRMGRGTVCDWAKVLPDARDRGISPDQVATEQGIKVKTVNAACSRYKIKLIDGRTKAAMAQRAGRVS